MKKLSRYQGFRQDRFDRTDTPQPRRIGHGATAYTSVAGSLRQPQDSAPDTARDERKAPAAFPEPEDASLTGVTRSLGRRLLGLNIMSATRRQPSSGPARLPPPRRIFPAA